MTISALFSLLTLFCSPGSEITYNKEKNVHQQQMECSSENVDFVVTREYKGAKILRDYSSEIEFFAYLLDYSRQCEMLYSKSVVINGERGMSSKYLCKKSVTNNKIETQKQTIELTSSENYSLAVLVH